MDLGSIIQPATTLFSVLLVAKNYNFVESNLAFLTYFSIIKKINVD